MLNGLSSVMIIPPEPVFSHRLLVNRASCIVPVIAWNGLLQFASKRFPIQPLDAVSSFPGFSNLMNPFPAAEQPAFTFELTTETPSGPPPAAGMPVSWNAKVGTVVLAAT